MYVCILRHKNVSNLHDCRPGVVSAVNFTWSTTFLSMWTLLFHVSHTSSAHKFHSFRPSSKNGVRLCKHVTRHCRFNLVIHSDCMPRADWPVQCGSVWRCSFCCSRSFSNGDGPDDHKDWKTKITSGLSSWLTFCNHDLNFMTEINTYD